MASEELLDTVKDLGITFEAAFVPWSKSRNAHQRNSWGDAPQRNLNWVVRMRRNGVTVLVADYEQGASRCPAYDDYTGDVTASQRQLRIEQECETGIATGNLAGISGKPIEPDYAGFMYSLIREQETMDFKSYEEWARHVGHDEDSRKFEKLYRLALENAMRLRAAVGNVGLQKLRDAAADY